MSKKQERIAALQRELAGYVNDKKDARAAEVRKQLDALEGKPKREVKVERETAARTPRETR